MTRFMLLMAVGIAAFASQASADESVDLNRNVRVNPAVAGGGQLLLYPGGALGRVVPPLLEPGAPGNDTVRLHMPRRHAAVRRARVATRPAHAAPVTMAVTAPPHVAASPDLPPAPPKKTAPRVAATPAEDMFSGGIPLSFGTVQSPPPPPMAPASRTPASMAPASMAPASMAPTRVARVPANRVASNAPPKTATRANAASAALSSADNTGSLSKHGQVKFRPGATDVVPAAINGIRLLASDLNSALDAGAQRVELDAFGGPHGDRSSESRRLSLKRALTIRQLLIDAGVPAGRIDVRARGGASDGGAPDRVDVYVRA